MLKVADNPPILSPEAASPADLNGPWWVAHTKARTEKAFAHDLGREGIDYFLPLWERVIISGGRKRRVFKPLFTGYVFFTGDDFARHTAMKTHRLCQVLPVSDQPRLVEDLTHLHRAMQGEAAMDLYPDLAVGRRGRVMAGPLEGIEGTIVQWKRATRLVLQVKMLGQGAAVEIEADLLEPLDGDEKSGQKECNPPGSPRMNIRGQSGRPHPHQ